MPRRRILISSCLLGERVRYDGGDARTASLILDRWRREGRLVPFCPEVAGGLPVPRPPAEIAGGGGEAVLRGEAQVANVAGADVTEPFLEGARQALREARAQGVGLAILKDGSPSCGSGYIYDGGFQGVRRPGRGVTAALLEENGIRVFSETRMAEAAAYLSASGAAARMCEDCAAGSSAHTPGEQMTRASARHILVADEQAAVDLKTQIEDGADFGDMAREHSQCPSKAQGGALGEFGPGQMVPEFDKVVFSAEVGKVHGPVQTQFGYHLIEITKRG